MKSKNQKIANQFFSTNRKAMLSTGLAIVMFSGVALASSFPQQINFSKPLTALRTNPLHTAIQKGETDFVKKLIDYGADVNEVSGGMTPLMVAARYNKVEIIKYLLAHGAQVKLKDEKGFTALKYAELSLATEAALVLKQA